MEREINKPRNDGTWTEARYRGFIKSTLRRASLRWGPIYTTIKEAATEKKTNPKTNRMCQFYKCNCCGKDFPRKEIQVNHIKPVVPVEGFDSWDEVIERMFCEKEGLEVLCKGCHTIQTRKENEERKKHRNK